MNDYFIRLEKLFGPAAETLRDRTVLVAGLGGVGSFAVQALARSPIGRLIIIDKDDIEPSNLNRQLVARVDTVGKGKAEVTREDILKVSPECEVIAMERFYDSSMDNELIELKPDYILDCIDSVDSKKDLIRFAIDNDIPIISSMGMARKQDPSRLEITELEKTSYDPIAKILRTWKRKNRIRNRITVVSSTEPPQKMEAGSPLPSGIFVPGSAGLLMASRCVQDLLEKAAEKPETGAENE